MLFFFYGTLMDADVRADLLGDAARRLRVTKGILLNHRRRRARDGDYPVLVSATAGREIGVFVTGMDRNLALWAAHFEGPSYMPEQVRAQDGAGRILWAWSFLPTASVEASADPWDLRVWQRAAKPQVRRALAQWRREIVAGHPMSLDVPWRVRRRIAALDRHPSDQPRPVPLERPRLILGCPVRERDVVSTRSAAPITAAG